MTASPEMAAGDNDTLTPNDIHALPASPARPAPDDALRHVAGILARTGRPPWPSRIITAAVEDDARIDANGTQAFIHPNGPGLLIRDAGAPEISIAGTVIRHPGPPWGQP